MELSTIPGWAGSSWYFSPEIYGSKNDGEFVQKIYQIGFGTNRFYTLVEANTQLNPCCIPILEYVFENRGYINQDELSKID